MKHVSDQNKPIRKTSFQKCRRGVLGSLLSDSSSKIWVSHATCLSRGSGKNPLPRLPGDGEAGLCGRGWTPALLSAPTGHPQILAVWPHLPSKLVASSLPGPESLTLPISVPGTASCLCFLPEVLWVQVSSLKSLIRFECIFVHDVVQSDSLARSCPVFS